MKHTLFILLASLSLVGCTQQQRARKFGLEAEIQIPAGHKVEGATWKETNLWILTRPMRPGETPETWTLTESSSWGLVEGSVVMKETAPPTPAK